MTNSIPRIEIRHDDGHGSFDANSVGTFLRVVTETQRRTPMQTPQRTSSLSALKASTERYRRFNDDLERRINNHTPNSQQHNHAREATRTNPRLRVEQPK